jgi:hypothetical protein
VDKSVTDATNQAKPKKINLAAPSPTVTLKVTAAPIKLAPIEPRAIKQGTSLEIPVAVTRLYGFADAVQLKVKLPENAKGLTAADVAIAAGAAEGKLVVQAAADAQPAAYTLELQAISKFNGQDLPLVENIPLTVEAAAAK